MSFARQPLLSPEVEEQLRTDLEPLWLKTTKKRNGKIIPAYNAEEISSLLQFGVEGTPYEKLKIHSVYHYRGLFGFPPRKTTKVHTITEDDETRTTRYAVQPGKLLDRRLGSPDSYLEKIKETYPTDIIKQMGERWMYLSIEDRIDLRQMERKNLLYSAFNVILMYSPLRKSEIYERKLKDFTYRTNPENVDVLTVELFRKKKSESSRKIQPFDIPIQNPGMEIVEEWLRVRRGEVKGDETQLAFPISSWHALDAVKRIDKEGFPHYFRFKYITEMLSNPDFSKIDIHSDTGLHYMTIERYLESGTEIARARSLRKRIRYVTDEEVRNNLRGGEK